MGMFSFWNQMVSIHSSHDPHRQNSYSSNNEACMRMSPLLPTSATIHNRNYAKQIAPHPLWKAWLARALTDRMHLVQGWIQSCFSWASTALRRLKMMSTKTPPICTASSIRRVFFESAVDILPHLSCMLKSLHLLLRDNRSYLCQKKKLLL